MFRHNLSLKCKKMLLTTKIFTILRYNSEYFALTKVLKKKIDAFEMWCYRRVLKISWTSLTTNKEVLERMGIEKCILLEEILHRKCTYLGHVARGSAGPTLKALCMDERREGRGRRRWTDDLEQIVEGGNFMERTKKAEDREFWRAVQRVRWPGRTDQAPVN